MIVRARLEGALTQWLVPGGMFGVMLGMGLTLSLEDFQRIARMPGATVVGTLLQLVAMPLAGLLLARAFALEPLLAAGLVVIAACPGGVMSNVLVHLAKADTALSITLTASATTVTLFTIPLWVQAAVRGLGEDAAGISMPVLETAWTLGMFTIVPVGVGMILRYGVPNLVPWEAWLTRASTVVIVAALTIEGARRDDLPLEAFAASWTPSLLLLFTALVMGIAIPLVLRLGSRDAATIAVELCIKNSVLGLFVATQALGSLVAAVPTAVYMTFQIPVGILALVLFRIEHARRVRGAAAG